ncbi:MAG TPA: sel1 repeat family protein [Rhodocyclaceae bacterium]|nr:sel1 repeat family protein [Rhodocyclaceae bacterium]
MSVPEPISCPKCESRHFRESRWRSHDEKFEHAGMQPYRCTKCAHRFFVAAHVLTEPRKWRFAGTASLLATVLVGVTIFFGLDDREPTHDIDPQLEQPVQAAPVTAEILKAAEDGDADSQFRVGKSLLYGALSDKRKTAEALQWLQQAAENGSTEAMVQLGRLYRNGVGALQNYKLSSEWITRAAHSGDAEGMLELGRLYRDGIGFERDPTRAYVWLNRSAAALNSEAAYERDSLARRLTPEQVRAAQNLSALAQLEPDPDGTDEAE